MATKAGDPDDLVTLREAEARTGVPVDTIRAWIYKGKGSPRKKLRTYRIPGGCPETIYVSKEQVLRMRTDLAKRTGPRPVQVVGSGGYTVSLEWNHADELRNLRQLMQDRLGCNVSMRDAVVLAVAMALRKEVSHRKGPET